MARFTWIALVLAAGCASVPGSPPSSLERITALEDARGGAAELAAFAHDADPLVRARAATALGRLWFPEEGAEVTSALLAALGDGDATVRAAAAFALGVRGDPSAAEQLLVVALDRNDADKDALVRARALEAATKLERPDLRERMLDGLLDPDPRVRLEAAEGASRWPTSEPSARTVDPRLASSLATEQDRAVIVYTLFALERRKAQRADHAFLYRADSDDAEQRLFAVRGLKALVPDLVANEESWRTFDVLTALRSACADADWRIACEAVLGLGAARDNASLAQLAASAAHGNAHVRRCAWEALTTAAGGIDNRERLTRALDNFYRALDVREVTGLPAAEPDPAVRVAILECLCYLGGRFSEPAEEEGEVESFNFEIYLDYDAAERAALARAATRSPDHSIAERESLFQLASGPAARREAVVASFEQVPEEQRAAARAKVDAVLAAIDTSPDLVVREAAIEALATYPSAETRALLCELLADPDNGIRLSAATALLEMPDASDLEALTRCYDSSSGDGANEIRFNVLRAAGKIGGDGAWKLLMKGLADSNAFVRRVAREELAKLDPQSQSRTDALALAPAAREVTPLDLPGYAAKPLVDVVTNRGTLRFELFPDETPVHVASFLALAAQDHYDGTTWHRVVPDFVIQGGDYRGDGNGGGTWKGQDQSLRHEVTPRKYVRGSLGMPRNEDVDSGGSQIFVTHRATPHLDGRYTIFGELRDGFDVLDAIEVGDTIVDVVRVR